MRVALLLFALSFAAAAPPPWARGKGGPSPWARGKGGLPPWVRGNGKNNGRNMGKKNGHGPGQARAGSSGISKQLLEKMQSDCGVPYHKPNTLFIVGGIVANAHSWPWQALLKVNGNLVCGGSLVTNTHIVTAAHCVTSYSADDWEVVLGEHSMRNIEGTEASVRVRDVTYHSRYSGSTLDNDVAVMTLTDPVTFTEAIRPVCLPDSISFIHEESAYTTGWGTTSSGGRTSDVLRQVDVPIIQTQECRTYYGSEITQRMICAGTRDGGKDACQGDSGGPLVVERNNKWYLAGITSWGYGCAQANNPGVYAKTTALMGWITGQTQG